jgi:hypothetical protein
MTTINGDKATYGRQEGRKIHDAWEGRRFDEPGKYRARWKNDDLLCTMRTSTR